MGTYFNKTGGIDGLPNTEITIKTLWYALKKFPDYNIIMEGVIASTVFSTYAKLFQEVQEKYPELKIIVLNLLPPLEVCLKRIQQRNGGKPIKEELVASKWNSVAKNATKFADVGIISLRWDNSVKTQNFDEKMMVDVMMDFINKSLNKRILIQLRGTSGSGKSYIAFKILKKYNFNPVKKDEKIIGYYAEDANLFIVGKYETACGGCDSLKSQDDICKIIVYAMKNGYNG